MHLATAPSAETEHQSAFLQMGQGAALDTRTQLLALPTFGILASGKNPASARRPASNCRAFAFSVERPGVELGRRGVGILPGDRASAPQFAPMADSAQRP